MRSKRTARQLAVIGAVLASLVLVVGGCSGGGTPAQPQGGGSITGTVVGFVGAVQTPIGGQVVAVAGNTQLQGTSNPQTGVFTVSGVQGTVNLVVNPDANGQTSDAGYGVPLNPTLLQHITVATGQSVEIGAIVLGQFPPDPIYQ